MAEKSYRDALREAMIEEMDRDPNVLIMGEDIGVYEGTFRITAGMLKKYGSKRVIDTPIAEAGMAGTAVGMAMLGLRPIVEMMTMNFAIVAADQILNHAAKVRYFSGGQVDVPMVIRGLRAVSDFEAELQMAHMNHRLAPGIDTVFFMTALEHGYLSSSLVREIVRFGGDPAGMVPSSVVARLVAVAAAEGAPPRVR